MLSGGKSVYSNSHGSKAHSNADTKFLDRAHLQAPEDLPRQQCEQEVDKARVSYQEEISVNIIVPFNQIPETQDLPA